MEKNEKFEDKITKIEKIVNELENGEIDLDDSITKYFEAVKLVRECDEKLKNFENQVINLIDEKDQQSDFEVKE